MKSQNNTFKKTLLPIQKGLLLVKLSKTKYSNLTVFAFDKGQNLSEHTATFDTLVQILEGTAKIIITKKPNILNEGAIIMMPANIPHALEAEEKFKMLLTMLKV